MHKKIFHILFLICFLSACSGTFDSVKRGLTGQKKQGGDEFLVEKKDPLILPPDFENLPSPDERSAAKQETSLFEKKLENLKEETETTPEPTSVENSILRKIRSK